MTIKTNTAAAASTTTIKSTLEFRLPLAEQFESTTATLQQLDVAGHTVYLATCPGYSSDWCWSAGDATERLTHKVHGLAVSNAPADIASEAEIKKVLEVVRGRRYRDGGATATKLEAALAAGMNSLEWLVATAVVVAHADVL